MRKVLFAAAILLPVVFVVLLLRPVLFSEEPVIHNSLTQQEMEEGWRLLFDGESTENWHNYGQTNVGPAWKTEGGALLLYVGKRAGNKVPGGGDLVTDEIFRGDFEFKIDWKVSRLANSGVFFFVQESPDYTEMYHTGLELQASDNALYEGSTIDKKNQAGDIYGVVSSGQKAVNPVGEWNNLHVVHKDGKLQITLNGFPLHDVDLQSPDWTKAMAESPLAAAPVGKGVFEGRIGLQDWGSMVWYRNIKFRQL